MSSCLLLGFGGGGRGQGFKPVLLEVLIEKRCNVFVLFGGVSKRERES